MTRLVYSAITSLDGYVADANGSFDWSVPDDVVHTVVNDLERSIGTYLYGRRMYDVMVAWETIGSDDQRSYIRDYAEIWRSADKVVYSTSLQTVSSARTRIERDFDPADIQHLKDQVDHDISVSGPHLAGQALAQGLVDEIHLFVSPVVVGGGTRALPDSVRLDLELVDDHRFGNGVVHLHYRVSASERSVV